MPQLTKLPRGTEVPNHLAIIPDGNRRWARSRGLHTLQGHKAGFERAVELGRAARKWGIHTVTLWGFSTENWDRTREEIEYLMKLYVRVVDNHLADAHKEKVKLIHLGRKDRLPKFLLDKIRKAEEETAHYDKYIANLALDYGGQDDIVRATKRMINEGKKADEIDKDLFDKYLDTGTQDYPYVDLLIRTSGEQRTSGLMMWQMQYAEMYWVGEHFPDFTTDKLYEAISDYSRRRRRFGADDKVKHFKFKPQMVARLELDWWRLGKIPEGTKFIDYATNHLKEQFGMSTKLAREAGTLMIGAIAQGDKNKWDKAGIKLRKFYRLMKEEIKLAFEPSFVASLDLKLLQKRSGDIDQEFEDTTREYLSEVYRISDFQAAKAAHLRTLAAYERSMAERNGNDEIHWQRAKDYLEKYYQALKECVG
jgi:undecaprenyl diphosphate synthase